MPTFKMILTAAGAAKVLAASAGGPAVVLTQMAVGDGNGNPIAQPTGAETTMVREVYRSQLNSLAVNAMDATMMQAEMSIPSETGNFAIHEVAIFDGAGAMFAYGNFPATWKPIPTDGSSRDMTIQAAMKVTNSAVINLVIDTSIVAATRQWVLATVNRAALLPGGTTGQVLRKKTNAPGDTEWYDPAAGLNILVNAVKEVQTAAAAQVIFNLTVCTTTGLAVYVDGLRKHDATMLTDTQVQLATAPVTGAKVLFVQNEPNDTISLRRLVAGRGYFMGQI